MSINKFITNLDLARQAEIMSGETAVFQGGIELGIPFSGFPSGVDTSTIVSLGIVGAEFAAFSGNTGTTVFNVTDPSSPYYSISATTLSASPYTIIDDNSITETVSATTYPTIMTFTALSGDCCSTPISVSFTPPIIQELYDRGLYDGLFNGLGQASIGTTYIDESFYNVGSVFSGANLNMEIVEYGVHGATPAWVTGTTSGTVVEYSALTQYWVNPIYENLTSGLTLPITPESADTQTSDYIWTLTDSTIIDENLVGLQYTGYSVTYSFNDVIIDPESPSITGGVTGATSADTYYLGTVTATLENYSAGTLDYKGSTNWLIVNGSATIDERLTTDRLTIHTLGTGSPVTMLGVDVNGNVVGGSGGTTDDTGAFTSTTANNSIIPTNAAGNTNDSDYASVLGGRDNYLKSGSTYSTIVVGYENTITGSTSSAILGGQSGNISGGEYNALVGGSANEIVLNSINSTIFGGISNTLSTESNYSSIFGGANNIMIDSSASHIIGGDSNTITGSSSFSSDVSTIVGSIGSKIYDSSVSFIGGSSFSQILSDSDSSFIGGGNNNNIESGSTHSFIGGGEDNTISGHTHSFIIGGSGNTINYSAFFGDGEGIIGSTNTIIEGSKNTLINSSADSGIYGGQLSSIQSSYESNIYNDMTAGGENFSNTIIGSRLSLISGTTGGSAFRFNSLISTDGGDIYDSTNTTIIAGRGDIHNTIVGGIFGGTGIISASTSQSYSVIVGARNAELYDSNTSIIIGGVGNYMNDSGGSLIAGGDGNVMDTSDNSAIVGGVTNVIDNALRSVVLGGQDITATDDDTVYMNKLYVTDPTEGNFYTSLDNAAGAQTVLSGTSDSLSRMSVTSPNVGGIGLGVRGESETSYSGYGKQGDGFIYSTTGNNGINIISAAGSGTDDYIRFYAGGDASTLTNSDLMIVGSGSTRGNVGIGTETPTEKLDINGNAIVSGTLNIGTLGGGTSVNNLGIDASGNVVSGNTGSFLVAKAPEAIVTHSLTAKGIPDGQVISGYTDIRYNNTDISGTLTTPFGTFDNTTGIFTTNTDCILNIQAWIHLKANTASTTAWETGATPTQIGLGICPNNATDIFVGDFITILPSVSRGLDVTTGITQRVLSGTTFRIKILNQTSRAYPGPGVVSGDYMRFSITRID